MFRKKIASIIFERQVEHQNALRSGLYTFSKLAFFVFPGTTFGKFLLYIEHDKDEEQEVDTERAYFHMSNLLD